MKKNFLKLCGSLLIVVFMASISMLIYADVAKQPLMNKALSELKEAKLVIGEKRKAFLESAKKLLKDANDNKGGHRVSAIKYIDEALSLMEAKKAGTKEESDPAILKVINYAISEVEQGIEAGADGKKKK